MLCPPPAPQKLPEDWQCPTCGADKKLFVSKQRQVAGFAENQVGCSAGRSAGLSRLACPARRMHAAGHAGALALALQRLAQDERGDDRESFNQPKLLLTC